MLNALTGNVLSFSGLPFSSGAVLEITFINCDAALFNQQWCLPSTCPCTSDLAMAE